MRRDPEHVLMVPALDGLRGVAASLVVLTHAAFFTGVGTSTGVMGHVLARGDVGVAVFFALSGFLLHRGLVTELHATGRLRTRAYLARRAARILPAYWIALLVVSLATRPETGTWLLNALGLHIYVPDAHIDWLGQSWSVATEMSFYLVLPLIVLALEPLRRRAPGFPLRVLVAALVATTALSLLVGPAVFGEDLLLERLLPWRAPHFLVGMICAEATLAPGLPFSRKLRRRAADPAGTLLVGAAAYLFLTTTAAGPYNLEPAHGAALLVRTTLSTVVAGALLVPLVLARGSAWSRVLSHPGARWLGLVSYGVFLWHLPVFHALYAFSGVAPFTGGIFPLLALGVPITLALAALSHQVVERPATRAVAKMVARRTARRQAQREQQHDPGAPLENRAP